MSHSTRTISRHQKTQVSTFRGRAACNACRSRKQKCDEARPACSRCTDLGRCCTWPASRRRGPAKGYTEALENRLRVTENALIRLWQASSADALQAAFGSGSALIDANSKTAAADSDGEIIGRGGPDKLLLVKQWETFPLTSASEVEQWALHNIKETTKSSKDPPSRSVSRTESLTRLDRLSTEPSTETAIQQGFNGHHLRTTPSAVQTPTPTATSTMDWTPESLSLQKDRSPWLHRPTQLCSSQPEGGRTAPTSLSAERSQIVFSEEFQQRFLW
ncbi:hypothetical protein B0T10DRAFT_490775 [Thelonectria olida]|uniref:Zn(2)-C6 fungal-type domain-containing protein n=1 Tax=Thelonectria olida TaxID=1576542 RepID=A0A9P9AN28_9HYPO|nr:hypothetical protein B0T10DRAFT_490775 [Thelonectria olida]